MSPRNVTGLVDALVATGFVSREPHPSDRRATLVRFTEHGADVARSLERDQHEFARTLFAGMPKAQLDGFVQGLDAVLDRLRALRAPTWRRSAMSDRGSDRGLIGHLTEGST